MDCHFLLYGIFPIQGWNPSLLHWQGYSLSQPPGKPRYIYIYHHFSGFSSRFGYHGAPCRVPHVTQQTLTGYHFYTWLCICVIPASHSSTPRPFPSWYPYTCSLCLSLSFLFRKEDHLCHFPRFHIYALIYNICFSLYDFLHPI